MPPPELWGPAIWTLFHVLAEKVNEDIYPRIAGQLFDVIKRICSALPCPECAQDATQFLAKVKVHELRTKNDFKNMIYLFHNYVNAKKRKPLFNYSNLVIYKRYNIVSVFNRFISCYHTKGNMRLLAESFQRQLIVRNVREWFSRNLCFFMPCYQPVPNVPEPTPTSSEVKTEAIENEKLFVAPSDVVVEEPLKEAVAPVEEPQVVVEEPLKEVVVPVEEPQVVVEEPLSEGVDPVEEPQVVVEEPLSEGVDPVEEPQVVVEEPLSEGVDPVEEPQVVVEEPLSEEIVSEANEDPTSPLSDSTVSDSIESEAKVSEEQTKPKRGRKKKTV